MAAAIAFSLVVFVFNSSYPQIVELDRSPGTMYYHPAVDTASGRTGCLPQSTPQIRSASQVKVLRFEAPLWFANSARFLDRMLLEIGTQSGLKGMVLDMSAVPWVDFSAGVAVKKLLARAKEEDVAIAFAHANNKVKVMIKSVAGLNESSFFETNFDAKLALDGSHARNRDNDRKELRTVDHIDVQVLEDAE